MRLILHLLETKLIPARLVVRALLAHLRSTPPLGQLALYRGVLQVSEVVLVLDMQLEQPHLRFGEIAVELGLCTPAQIDALLDEQRARAVSVEDLLVGLGAISAGRLALESRRLRGEGDPLKAAG